MVEEKDSSNFIGEIPTFSGTIDSVITFAEWLGRFNVIAD